MPRRPPPDGRPSPRHIECRRCVDTPNPKHRFLPFLKDGPTGHEAVLQDIDSYWRNGNPVAVEIVLRKPEASWSDPHERGTQVTKIPEEVVLEVWGLELRPETSGSGRPIVAVRSARS